MANEKGKNIPLYIPDFFYVLQPLHYGIGGKKFFVVGNFKMFLILFTYPRIKKQESTQFTLKFLSHISKDTKIKNVSVLVKNDVKKSLIKTTTDLKGVRAKRHVHNIKFSFFYISTSPFQ